MTQTTAPPDTPDALADRALRRVQDYLSRGLFDAAEAAAATQAKRTPNRFDVWLIASFAHAAAGHLRAAEFAVGRALSIRPAYPSALLQHARLSVMSGRTALALASLRALAEDHVLDLDAGLRVVEMLNKLGECEWAQTLILKLQGRREAPALELMLAQAETFTLAGDLDDAASVYEELIRSQPRMAFAHLGLARLKPEAVDVTEVERLLAETKPGTDAEVWLAHAAWRAFEKQGRFDAAAPLLARALRARRSQYKFDAAAVRPVFDALLHLLPQLAGSAAEAPALGGDGILPVFVIGLPDSGATLIERVLGNQHQVVNGGELPEFAAVMRDAGGLDAQTPISLALIERFTELDWDDIGARYRERLRARYPGVRVVTDSGPANVLYAAAILRALPEARIIHVACEPMQQCFSLLREPADDRLLFANDQSEVVTHYLAHAEWMRQVELAFPKRVQSVRYEQWHAVPGLVTRAMFRFCNLEYEPGYEDPSMNRKPIGFGSISRLQHVPGAASSEVWRNYRDLLQPMHRLLADAGLAPRDS